MSLTRSVSLAIWILLLWVIPASGQSVYKTPSGKKYHLASCKTVKNVATKITLKEALNLGLDPCKVCKPPVAGPLRISSEDKSAGENKTVQCSGKTKAGTRCKHKTRIANGFCFQHQPKN